MPTLHLPFVELVTLLALVQMFAFGVLSGRMKGKHGVITPAMYGHPISDRYVRVHQNTLEIIVILIPALWIAASYWGDYVGAGLGAIYLIGRLEYLRGYVKNPKQRHIGFGMSMVPIFLLIILSLVGVARALMARL